ncbi:MAG: hypothetical protein ACKO0V_13435, partial [bacterium]
AEAELVDRLQVLGRERLRRDAMARGRRSRFRLVKGGVEVTDPVVGLLARAMQKRWIGRHQNAGFHRLPFWQFLPVSGLDGFL